MSRLKTQSLPPGPRLPVAVQTLAWFKRPVPFVLRAQQRYGDTFTIHIGSEPPWVMLGHPGAIKQVFTAAPETLLAGEANEVLRPVLGDNSVLILDEPAHMRDRKLMLPPFHGARMQRYGDLMREITEAEIATWPTGAEFPLAPHMQAITLDIILRAVFGVRDDRRLRELRDALRNLLDFLTNPINFGVVAVLGVDRATSLPPFRRIIEPVDRLLAQEIAAHRDADDLDERDDILSLLLQARYDDGAGLSDRALRDELLTLLVAGHETTATSLSWAFERLLRTPGAIERLRDEAQSGRSDYALAVAHETLRLRPVLPVVLRRLIEPMTIGGHDLPAGTTIAPSIVMVHRREDVYTDPHAFRPQRFVDQAPGTYTWIPFGGGVRRCLGASFALYELQVVMQTIVERLDMGVARDLGEGVARRAITLAPARGGAVVVKARRGRSSVERAQDIASPIRPPRDRGTAASTR